MDRRLGTIGVALALVLLPGLASSEALGTESASSSAALNPLTFVEAQFDLGLTGATAADGSPDGKHVYVACYDDDGVATFSRNASTGALIYEGVVQDGGSVDGLNGAISVVTSPDGAHVYVAGKEDDGVATFSRSATTGALTYHSVVKDGGGVDGLNGARSVAISPDGKHVYVASDQDNAVAVLGRNATTGALTYHSVVKDGGGVDGLDGARSVTVSPDGKHVYVAGYDDDGVATFSRNATTGALTYFNVIKDGIAFEGLDGARSVAISPDGKHIYVAGYHDDAVAMFSRNATNGALTYTGYVQDSPTREGLNGAWSVTVSPDGAHVYVVGNTDDAVAIFGRNVTTGALTYQGLVQDGHGDVRDLDGASSVVISPDGAHLYVASYFDQALTFFSRHTVAGALTLIGVCRSFGGLEGAAGTAVSPDGKHVYVTGNDDATIVALKRNAASGALAFVQRKVDGLNGVDGLAGARAVIVSPDGAHVYVAGFDDHAVAGFSRIVYSGELSYEGMVKDGVGGVDGLNGPQDLAISPDGKHLYVASYNDDAVAAFSRDEGTGALTYLGRFTDGVGADGLDGAYAVVVSPDGKHVYVAGITDDAVAIFSRNATSGALTYEGVVKDTDSLINGLNGANSLAISPDGHHLYVASRDEDALQVLLRNTSTGALFEIEVHRDGIGGVDGLNGAWSVAISPDGSQVYVAGQSDDALAVFARDAGWGGLSFVGMHEDGVSGVDGLGGAMSVAVSPDCGHVYVGGYSDDGVAVFAKWRVYLPLVLRE